MYFSHKSTEIGEVESQLETLILLFLFVKFFGDVNFSEYNRDNIRPVRSFPVTLVQKIIFLLDFIIKVI